jgi:hypothetical protein
MARIVENSIFVDTIYGQDPRFLTKIKDLK